MAETLDQVRKCVLCVCGYGVLDVAGHSIGRGHSIGHYVARKRRAFRHQRDTQRDCVCRWRLGEVAAATGTPMLSTTCPGVVQW